MKKTCNDCGRTKPVEEFHRNTNSKDGYRHKCKSCYSIESANKTHTLVKIRDLTDDIEKKDKFITELEERIEAFTIKCDIAEKKCNEYYKKCNMLEEKLKEFETNVK